MKKVKSSCLRGDYVYHESNNILEHDEIFDVIIDTAEKYNLSSFGYAKPNAKSTTDIASKSATDFADQLDNTSTSYHDFNYKPGPIENIIQIYKFYNSLLNDITNQYGFKQKRFNTEYLSEFNSYIKGYHLKRLVFDLLKKHTTTTIPIVKPSEKCPGFTPTNILTKHDTAHSSKSSICSIKTSVADEIHSKSTVDSKSKQDVKADLAGLKCASHFDDATVTSTGGNYDVQSSSSIEHISLDIISNNKITQSESADTNSISLNIGTRDDSKGNLRIIENQSPRITPINRVRKLKPDVNTVSSSRLISVESINSLMTSNNDKRKRSSLEYDFSFFKKKYLDKNEITSPKIISERTRGLISSNGNLCNRNKVMPDSIKKQGSSMEHTNSRRCIISNNKTSSDSGKVLKKSTKNSFGIFDTHADESNWNSEMWNPYTNVITCKKMKIGHGSFSVVSIAILRLYTHVTNNKTNTDNTGSTSPMNSMKDLLREIRKHCDLCKDNRTMSCAVKSISDEYPQSRFQYIREKEMMLHFNSHVLKPLSCRSVVNEHKKFYQLLLPKAHGDLLSMLNKLILYRNNPRDASDLNSTRTTIYGLSENEVKYLFVQIISGVTFIHMCFQGDIYRHSDIKLANILVFCAEEDRYKPMSWRLVLADFGCSILINPTQHLECSSSFKGLHLSLSKEWTQQLSQQLSSYIRGTVRYNAPETLSYDRKGSRRSNHNQNSISVHDKTHTNLTSAINVTKIGPKVWGNPNVNVSSKLKKRKMVDRIEPISEHDTSEYYRVDMRADMWSCGIILSELAKFGFNDENVYGLRNISQNIEDVKARLNLTLGRGLFCRNTSSLRKTLGKSNNSPITDDDLNKSLAFEISKKCNVPLDERIKNLKETFHSWELPNFSDEYWNLLAKLLAYNPSERLIGIEVLGHDWFNDSEDLFNTIDSLTCSTNSHLPIGHFYSACHTLAGSGIYSENNKIPHTIENSDLVSKTLYNYAKVSHTPHAWFAGPLHYRLSTIGEMDLKLPDAVAHVCTREACVLENREKELFGSRGAILSKILKVKSEYKLSWQQVLSSYTTHLLGKALNTD